MKKSLRFCVLLALAALHQLQLPLPRIYLPKFLAYC